MNFRKKLFTLAGLIVAVIIIEICLPLNGGIINIYDKIIYYPLQWLRDLLVGFIPFSVGDVLYVMAGGYLLFTVVRWVYYLFSFRDYKYKLGVSLLNTINAALIIYICFVFGWGANYYKKPLAKEWKLDVYKDTLKLAQFDSLLISRLNLYAPQYQQLSQTNINDTAIKYYKKFTDTHLGQFGLNVKNTLFSYFLQRLAIEGYYNPFTGEGQISNAVPAFMLPFVVTHEMAHQAGIAAEGDANLMAYTLCTTSGNPTFSYSATLNVWLYVDRRLFYRDSVKEKALNAELNPLTKRHIDTIESLSRLYDNDASKYSSQMFDNYLKMQQQKEGIRSYGNVVANAWRLEQQRKTRPDTILHLP
ncbi:MAG: DUF3810 domain-containing protein [Taibaiella sp.]|nr:DUF3810 domain-containing protein [Taibaiella sp.]